MGITTQALDGSLVSGHSGIDIVTPHPRPDPYVTIASIGISSLVVLLLSCFDLKARSEVAPSS